MAKKNREDFTSVQLKSLHGRLADEKTVAGRARIYKEAGASHQAFGRWFLQEKLPRLPLITSVPKAKVVKRAKASIRAQARGGRRVPDVTAPITDAAKVVRTDKLDTLGTLNDRLGSEGLYSSVKYVPHPRIALSEPSTRTAPVADRLSLETTEILIRLLAKLIS